MPRMLKKKMAEQGYNYLDGPIHSMTEFFETRIKNLEKSIPLKVLSRNSKNSKKGSKKKKAVTFDHSEDEDLIKDFQERSFASTMVLMDIPRINALHSRKRVCEESTSQASKTDEEQTI